MKNLFIIGASMGAPNLLTRQAYETMAKCQEILAFGRIANSLKEEYPQIKICTYIQLLQALEISENQDIAVLVSGDVGFFSMSKTLCDKLNNNFKIYNICGLNSMQYLCSLFNISYEDINNVTLHGRGDLQSLSAEITYNKNTFVLTGGGNNAKDILVYLKDKINPSVKIIVAQNLSMPNEKITSDNIDNLSEQNYDDLTVILFQNKEVMQKSKSFFDDEFIKGKAPMTKQEIRWVSTSYLGVKPQDIVWDIGAGTGSVSVELSTYAYKGCVYAIEKKAEAFELLCQNRLKHGVYNLVAVQGDAMEQIVNLPVPNKVFIGGSSGDLPQMVEYILKINPQVKITINAITLETLTQAIDTFKQNNFNFTVNCINSASSRQMGNYNMMMANNPVYIITGEQYADEN